MNIKTYSVPSGAVGAKVEINYTDRVIVTRLFGGTGKVTATREPNIQNMYQAAVLGYDQTAQGCWMSLIDHEVLHLLVSQAFFHCVSPVMLHEAGLEDQAYDLRLFEESLVIAHQRILCLYEASDLIVRLNYEGRALEVLHSYKKLNIPYDPPASHSS